MFIIHCCSTRRRTNPWYPCFITLGYTQKWHDGSIVELLFWKQIINRCSRQNIDTSYCIFWRRQKIVKKTLSLLPIDSFILLFIYSIKYISSVIFVIFYTISTMFVGFLFFQVFLDWKLYVKLRTLFMAWTMLYITRQTFEEQIFKALVKRIVEIEFFRDRFIFYEIIYAIF